MISKFSVSFFFFFSSWNMRGLDSSFDFPFFVLFCFVFRSAGGWAWGLVCTWHVLYQLDTASALGFLRQGLNYVAQTGFELEILLPQLPGIWAGIVDMCHGAWLTFVLLWRVKQSSRTFEAPLHLSILHRYHSPAGLKLLFSDSNMRKSPKWAITAQRIYSYHRHWSLLPT
jgi:hypothetical protein